MKSVTKRISEVCFEFGRESVAEGVRSDKISMSKESGETNKLVRHVKQEVIDKTGQSINYYTREPDIDGDG